MKVFYYLVAFFFILASVCSPTFAETKKCPGKCDGIQCGIPLCGGTTVLKYGDRDCICCPYCAPQVSN